MTRERGSSEIWGCPNVPRGVFRETSTGLWRGSLPVRFPNMAPTLRGFMNLCGQNLFSYLGYWDQTFGALTISGALTGIKSWFLKSIYIRAGGLQMGVMKRIFIGLPRAEGGGGQ